MYNNITIQILLYTFYRRQGEPVKRFSGYRKDGNEVRARARVLLIITIIITIVFFLTGKFAEHLLAHLCSALCSEFSLML
jgi:hypothetical protein